MILRFVLPKSDALGVSRYAPLIEIKINALQASLSFFSVLLLLVIIRLIPQPFCPGHALLICKIYAIWP